ncbi:MAG: hypothetical protein QOK43_1546 [Acidimicrobiaceae bacterium]|nr:hypothetical protein [Acidimicrobiaceae bacterium]
MTPTPVRRVVVVAMLVALLIAAVVIDRTEKPGSSTVRTRPGVDQPESTPVSSLSSSWYCPGGNADGGALNGAVTVMNPRDEGVHGTITAIPSQGDKVSQTFDLGPRSARRFVLAELVKAPWAAALVDFDGGGAVVEQMVGNPTEYDVSACSPTASSTWYFPWGSTAKDASLTLALFNPFPDDAIVDLAFATGEGRRVPGDFEGIVVPAESVVPVDIGAHVRRQDVVSTEVKVRAGRVVAGQDMARTVPGASGVSSSLGAPQLGDTWYFPDGLAADGVVERYEVFNPTGREARVDIEVALEQGEAEPFELTIPAQGRFTLAANTESRIPKNVPHAAVARSVNGVPVVVARVFESTTPRVGRTDMLGARHPARTWALAVGGASETMDEWVVVYNPGERPATVSVGALADGQTVAIEGLQGVVVPAGRRVALRLADHIKRNPMSVVVQSSRDVVVERALFGAPALASTIGVPLG